MADTEKIKEIAVEIGGKEWEMLADAVADQEFRGILTPTEQRILDDVDRNHNTIRSQRDHISSIVSKYLTWFLYKNTKLQSLKTSVTALSKKVKESENELETIRNSAKYIGGATVLVEYSKAFADTAKNHSNNAEKQLKWYLCSLAGFGLIVAFVFFFSISEFEALKGWIADDLKGLPLNTGFLALKAFLLIFAYQITQFFRKNYGAEKHLQEVYQHRSDVLQSLHAVYNALSDTNEKDEILRAGALFAYERGETGYITTKEGAGSADGLIEGIFGRIFR